MNKRDATIEKPFTRQDLRAELAQFVTKEDLKRDLKRELARFATKQELSAVKGELKTEIAKLATKEELEKLAQMTQEECTLVRKEASETKAELKKEIADLREDMGNGFVAVLDRMDAGFSSMKLEFEGLRNDFGGRYSDHEERIVRVEGKLGIKPR